MKKDLLLLVLLFVGAGLGAQEKYTVVKVQVKEKVVTQKTLPPLIYFTDCFTGEDRKYNGKLTGGIFECSFPLRGPYDVVLKCDKQQYRLLVVPGDTLLVTVDSNSLRFSGKQALTNAHLQRYLVKGYGMNLYARSRQLKAWFDSSSTACKSFLYQRYEKEKQLLHEFITQYQTDTFFNKWARNNLLYECAFQLMYYASLQGFEKMPVAYFDFFEKFPLQQTEATISSQYANYVDEYFQYDMGKASRTGKNDQSHFTSLPPGILRDLLLKRFASEVSAAGMDDLVEPEPAPAPAKNSTDSTLQQLVAPYKGKVVYIDIWATWCAPCREAMPASQKLRAALMQQDIVFLYLCAQSAEKTWRSVIGKMKIEGKHRLLDEQQYRQLEMAYNISGIPHYMIVDKKGTIVNKNAFGPSDPDIKNQLLKLAWP